MKRLILILALSLPVAAQNWSGILSSSRAIDWKNAGAGTIPTRSTICTTESPGVSLAQLNTDIANCPSGEVVYLSAGTYTFSSQINIFNNNVTLRGAGADQTIIKWTASGSCPNGEGGVVCIFNQDNSTPYYPHNQATWTAGYAQGTTSLTLSTVTIGSISNLKAGSLLVLIQEDTATDQWPTQPWNCELNTGVLGSCSQQGGENGQGSPVSSETQTVTVTSVSGTGPYTVNFTPGLYSPNWSASYNPVAVWSNNLPVSGAGVENMTLDASATTDSSGTSGALIFFGWVTNSWVNGVRTLNTGTPPYRTNIWIIDSCHITVENSYVYGSNGYDLSYGIESGFNTSDNLIQNNILQHTASAEMENGTQGTVYAYNYSVDNYYTAQGISPNFQQSDSYGSHQGGNNFDLFEGNVGATFAGDDIHGVSWMITAFRNYWKSRDGAFKTSNTNAVELDSYVRFYNLIGNVLGESSAYNQVYKNIPGSTTDNTGCNSMSVGSVAVLNLGWGAGNGCYNASQFTYNDLHVADSIMLWGNYDVKTAAVRWCGNSSDTGWVGTCGSASEIPTGLSDYAASLPTLGDTGAGQSGMPASFYYNSQPPWWPTTYGTPPWPPIGPDVSGGSGPGSHTNAISAQLAFTNASYDSNYVSQATISAITESSTTATITLTGNAPACFVQYQSFWISGSSVAGYNILQQIATVSGATITFTATAGLGSASGGTVTCNAIKSFNANVYGTASNGPSVTIAGATLKGAVIQ